MTDKSLTVDLRDIKVDPVSHIPKGLGDKAAQRLAGGFLAEVCFLIKESPLLQVPHNSFEGYDIYGGSRQLHGLGGDLVMFVDPRKIVDLEDLITKAREDGDKAKERERLLRVNRSRIGLVLVDVMGHEVDDARLAYDFHSSFYGQTIGELVDKGDITKDLFRNLHWAYQRITTSDKWIAMSYTQLDRDGTLKMINAGQPEPYVYSRQHNKLHRIKFPEEELLPPLGATASACIPALKGHTRPKRGGTSWIPVRDAKIEGIGDILLLPTDGLTDVKVGKTLYMDTVLPDILNEHKDMSAQHIYEQIYRSALLYGGEYKDDFSLIVVKRTS